MQHHSCSEPHSTAYRFPLCTGETAVPYYYMMSGAKGIARIVPRFRNPWYHYIRFCCLCKNSDRSKSFFQIRQDVINVLGSDGETDRIRTDPLILQLLRAQL